MIHPRDHVVVLKPRCWSGSRAVTPAVARRMVVVVPQHAWLRSAVVIDDGPAAATDVLLFFRKRVAPHPHEPAAAAKTKSIDGDGCRDGTEHRFVRVILIRGAGRIVNRNNRDDHLSFRR